MFMCAAGLVPSAIMCVCRYRVRGRMLARVCCMHVCPVGACGPWTDARTRIMAPTCHPAGTLSQPPLSHRPCGKCKQPAMGLVSLPLMCGSQASLSLHPSAAAPVHRAAAVNPPGPSADGAARQRGPGPPASKPCRAPLTAGRGGVSKRTCPGFLYWRAGCVQEAWPGSQSRGTSRLGEQRWVCMGGCKDGTAWNRSPLPTQGRFKGRAKFREQGGQLTDRSRRRGREATHNGVSAGKAWPRQEGRRLRPGC